MDRLQWSVLALAQPASIQATLFPKPFPKGEELALNFEEGILAFRASELAMNAEERVALERLDRLLLDLSGQHNESFWLDDDSLFSDPRWDDIRASARLVVEAFGWALVIPPPSEDIYIESKN